jgi:hypothetical protein
VCASCGLGLLLEAREDAIPSARDAFLVIDSALLVQAMSREAQSLLGMTEELAVNRPVAELLVPADAETHGGSDFAAVVVQAAEGDYAESMYKYVRPWNTFGVRMRARISTCGPPRAALIVLEQGGRPRALQAVEPLQSARRAR